MSDFIDSTGDDRVINNVMRHGYRVLTDREKETMQKLKDDGLALGNCSTASAAAANWQSPKPRSKRQ